MKILNGIPAPLRDEHVIDVLPPLADDTDAGWMRRLNLFTGRALSHTALSQEQIARAGHLALRGQMLTSGVVNGLEVLIEPSAAADEATLLIHPGSGLAASGEDVNLDTPVQVRLHDIPVYAPAVLLDGQPLPPLAEGALLSRRVGASLGELIANGRATSFPLAAVLLLQPAVVDTLGYDDPEDLCDPDPRDYAYEDWRRTDAARLLLFLWPAEWLELPGAGDAWRNRLAYKLFERESQLGGDAVLPWEEIGVPLSLIGFDGEWSPLFADRAAVVRAGGRPRERPALVDGAGQPPLWQARLAQFSEQWSEAFTAELSSAEIAKQFRFLPPAGVVPRAAVDFANTRNLLFPASFHVEALPVPAEQIDLALQDSLSLAPIDTASADDVEILVPVPQAWYEPRLLLQEKIDGVFDQKITQFTAERNAWLQRREWLRRRQDLLHEAIYGYLPAYPVKDALALEDETLAGLPFAAARLHQSPAKAGVHFHGFERAAPLKLSAADTLVAYVRTDPNAPPLNVTLMFRIGTPGNAASFGWTASAYWGESFDGLGKTAGRHALGALPTPGVWTRLEVPVALLGAGAQAIDGMAFGLFDGAANWSWAGRSVDGVDTFWLADTLPTGAQLLRENGDEGWNWALADSSLTSLGEDEYGTETVNDVRSVSAIAALTQRWQGSAVADDFKLLPDLGLDAFIVRMQNAANAANDRIDFGFLRARTDIYRIRQRVLGGDAATRLATSPALAEIVQSGVTAMASQKELGDYFEAAKGQAVETTQPQPRNGGGDTMLRASKAAGARGTSEVVGLVAEQPQSSTLLLAAMPVIAFEPQVRIAAKTPVAPTTRTISTGKTVGSTTGIAVIKSRITESDVVGQSPIIGAAQNTVTVAARLDVAPAVETRNFAIEGKSAAANSVASLSGIGIKVADLVLPGYKKGSVGATVGDLLAGDVDDEDEPEPEEKHEAAFFASGIRAIDNTVALLRLLEGRVQLYRRVIDDCNTTRATLSAIAALLSRRLAQIADGLAESRHDVSVARALRDEEQQRLNAINQRRAAILAEQVQVIVFRRPRFADILKIVPLRQVYAGDHDDPVPACLSGHEGIPEELRDMVQLFRDAPLRWLPKARPWLDKLDRYDVLSNALQTAKQRAGAALTQSASSGSKSNTRLGRAISSVTVQQRRIIETQRSITAQFNVSAYTQSSWLQLREQSTHLLAIGDLLEAMQGRSELAIALAKELNSIGQVASCLYARFGEVVPTLRLGWAETLSEFDDPVNLRNLASLPRWGEIDFDQRRDLQSLVDWLFGRIETSDAQAAALMSDLVRICLLLASHAPVDDIIAGHLPSPVVARPGVKLDILVDPSRIRIGMNVLVHGNDARVLARGVVEDLSGGTARARVVQTVEASVQLTETMRVQFSNSTVLSLR